MTLSRRSSDAAFIKRYGWNFLIAFCAIITFVWTVSNFSATIEAEISAVKRVTTQHENDIAEIRAAIKETAKVVEQQTLNMVEVQTHFKYIREKLEKD